ncbi:MAG: HD domain-containing protein, partial [bacterium]|nr:HD domain-containing protein [bacterium]
MNLELLLSFLGKLEKLKCIPRHSWTSSGRQESVAEHSWRLAAIVYLLKDELKGYDIEKML